MLAKLPNAAVAVAKLNQIRQIADSAHQIKTAIIF